MQKLTSLGQITDEHRAYLMRAHYGWQWQLAREMGMKSQAALSKYLNGNLAGRHRSARCASALLARVNKLLRTPPVTAKAKQQGLQPPL